MQVPGDWGMLFTRTRVPESREIVCRCTWCGWTVRVRHPTDDLPAHECPGPQPRLEPKA